MKIFSREEFKLLKTFSKKYCVPEKYVKIYFDKFLIDFEQSSRTRIFVKKAIKTVKKRVFIKYSELYKFGKKSNSKKGRIQRKSLKNVKRINRLKKSRRKWTNISKKQSKLSKNRLDSDTITEQIKEQLNLLKSRKNEGNLFKSGINSKPSSQSVNQHAQVKISDVNQTETSESHDDVDSSSKSSPTSTPSTSKLDIEPKNEDKLANPDEETGETSNKVDSTAQSPALQKSKNFVDKLLSKFNKSLSNESIVLDTSQSTNSTLIIEDNSSDSSLTEFCGFNDNDSLKYKPKRLPTPPVENPSEQSAFVSETLNKLLKEYSLEDCSKMVTAEVKPFRPEDGLICKGAEMPKLDYPRQMISCKARTVAEKRQILAKRKDIKFLMAETESQIFWELKRRSKENSFSNFELVHDLQQQAIPFRRDIWKTASWLATNPGRFFFKTLEANQLQGQILKLHGGTGNYWSKSLDFRTSRRTELTKIAKYCGSGCSRIHQIRKLRQKNIERLERELGKFCGEETSTKSPKRKQLISTSGGRRKPGPLFSKIESYDNDEDRMMGRLEIYKMPKIQLEIFPRNGKQLPNQVKSYLKMIQPSTCITAEWAEFAASALQVKSDGKRTNEKITQSMRKSYTFEIPYTNNQTKMLVRRIKEDGTLPVSRSESELKSLDTPLDFYAKVDKQDPESQAVGDYLRDMIDSVAIGICQNEFIQLDPDLDYTRCDDDVSKQTAAQPPLQLPKEKSQISGIRNKNVRTTNSRVLKELKRLNATFIESQATTPKVSCVHEHCRLGCVCFEGRILVVGANHCRREACMFECTCKRDPLVNHQTVLVDDDGLTEEEMRMLREKATERLAKAEKDFSSTIVLTNDDPILIHNTQVVSKRCRKPPKMYKEYFEEYDEELQKPKEIEDSRKSSSAGTTAANQKTASTKITNAVRKSSIVERLSHCSVALDVNPDLDNLEMWCMVHCLYKCFCRGLSTRGQPFGFNEKELAPEPSSQHFPPALARSRNYTFERETPNTITTATSTIITKTTTPTTNVPTIDEELSIDLEMDSAARTRPVDHKKLWKKIEGNVKRNRMEQRKLDSHLGFRALLNRRIYDCMLFQKRLKDREAKKNLQIINTNSNEVISLDDDSDDDMEIIEDLTGVQEADGVVDKSIEPSKKRKIDEKSPVSHSMQSSFEKFIKLSSPTSNLPAKVKVTQQEKPKQTTTISTTNNTEDVFKMPHPIFADSSYQRTDITKLNAIVTRSMAHICETQKNFDKTIPEPRLKQLMNLNWDSLIEAYQNDLAYVWEIYYFENTVRHIMIALTTSYTMPNIPKATAIINIKAVQASDLTLMGRLINMKVSNEKTKNMAVLLFGHQHFWSVIGFAKSETNYMEEGVFVRPTPSTHPKLAKKINVLFRLLRDRLAKDDDDSDLSDGKLTTTSTTTVTTTAPTGSSTSNIEICDLSDAENKSIFAPIPILGDNRWLMLTVVNDFSDIYIPSWKASLKYERIVKTAAIAKRTQKTVRILCPGNPLLHPQVFLTPGEEGKIFFGPFGKAENPMMMLCQELDGKMLVREEYMKKMGIVKEQKTFGCWLYSKSSPNSTVTATSTSTVNSTSTITTLPSIVIEDDDPSESFNNGNETTPITTRTVKASPESLLKPIVLKEPIKLSSVVNSRSLLLPIIKLEPSTSVKPVKRPTSDTIELESSTSVKVAKLDTTIKSENAAKASSATPPKSELIGKIRPIQLEHLREKKLIEKLNRFASEIRDPLKSPTNNDDLSPPTTAELKISEPYSIVAKKSDESGNKEKSDTELSSKITTPTNSPTGGGSDKSKGIFVLPGMNRSTKTVIVKCIPNNPSTSEAIAPSDSMASTSSKKSVVRIQQSATSTATSSTSTTSPSSISVPRPRIIIKKPACLNSLSTTTSGTTCILKTSLVPSNPTSVVACKPAIVASPSLKSAATSSTVPSSEKKVAPLIIRVNNNKSATMRTLVRLKPPSFSVGPKIMPVEKTQVTDESKSTRTTLDRSETEKLPVFKRSDELENVLKKLSASPSVVVKQTQSNSKVDTVAVGQTSVTQSGAMAPSVTGVGTVKTVSPMGIVKQYGLNFNNKSNSKLTHTVASATKSIASAASTSSQALKIQQPSPPPKPTTKKIAKSDSILLSDDDDDDAFNMKLDGSEATPSSTESSSEDSKIQNLKKMVSGDDEQRDLLNNLKNSKTFLISKIKDLGHIPCLINDSKLLVKLPRIKNVLKIEADRMNFFLRWYIRKNVYGILPVNFQIKWEIVTDKNVLANYEPLVADTLNRNIVVTQYGLVDLRDDFDTENFMKLDPKMVSLLMLLKVAKLINIESVNLKKPMDIVDKAKDYMDRIKSFETSLIAQKCRMAKKLTGNKAKLKQLKQSLSPAVKAAYKAARQLEKSPPETKDTNNKEVVIVIDDD